MVHFFGPPSPPQVPKGTPSALSYCHLSSLAPLLSFAAAPSLFCSPDSRTARSSIWCLAMGGATAHGHAFHASSVISPLLSFSPRQFSSDLGACGPRVGAHTTRYTRKRCLGQLSYGLSYVARLIFLLYAAPTTDNVTSALLGIRNMIKEEHDPLFSLLWQRLSEIL